MGGGVVVQAKLPEWQLEVRFLGIVRIEADGHQNEVLAVGGAFAEEQDVVVPAGVSLEAKVRLQRRVLPANTVCLLYTSDAADE